MIEENIKIFGVKICLIMGELVLGVIEKKILLLDDRLFILLLNGGDLLESFVIYYFLKVLKDNDLVYCDIDELSSNGIKMLLRFLLSWNFEF